VCLPRVLPPLALNLHLLGFLQGERRRYPFFLRSLIALWRFTAVLPPSVPSIANFLPGLSLLLDRGKYGLEGAHLLAPLFPLSLSRHPLLSLFFLFFDLFDIDDDFFLSFFPLQSGAVSQNCILFRGACSFFPQSRASLFSFISPQVHMHALVLSKEAPFPFFLYVRHIDFVLPRPFLRSRSGFSADSELQRYFLPDSFLFLFAS